MGSATRQRNRQIKVRLNEAEYQVVVSLARQHDLPPSTYLRELGLEHRPRSTIDAQAVESIARLHGDLGRTAGLLKLWLTKRKGPAPSGQMVDDLLSDLSALRVEILATIERL